MLHWPLLWSFTTLKGKRQAAQHSFRASTEYAETHNLELVENYKDLAIPASRGRNVTEGDFSRFLKALRADKIPRGSYLLVEAIDRISRQDAKTARIILEIIDEYGIKLVTTIDDELYDENSDFGDMIRLLAIAERGANETCPCSKLT